MTFTVTVDPANAFGYRMAAYKSLLSLDIESALIAGGSLVTGVARANMQVNGNVDTGALSASIGTLSIESDQSQVTVTVGPSLTEMHPARFNPVKTYNDIGAFLERGTGPGGPWTWGGVAGSRWEGFFTRSWTGNAAHPFMVQALQNMAPAIVDLVKQAVARRW